MRAEALLLILPLLLLLIMILEYNAELIMPSIIIVTGCLMFFRMDLPLLSPFTFAFNPSGAIL